jgi:RHS repeat-associated protein
MKTHSHRVGIRTCSDYSPFGVELDGRTVSGGYRFGYQGSEKDDETKGNGNSYTTEFRQLDPRLGRWLSIDPLIAKFPWQSSYCAMDNAPMNANDPKGLKAKWIPKYVDGKISLIKEKGDNAQTLVDFFKNDWDQMKKMLPDDVYNDLSNKQKNGRLNEAVTDGFGSNCKLNFFFLKDNVFSQSIRYANNQKNWGKNGKTYDCKDFCLKTILMEQPMLQSEPLFGDKRDSRNLDKWGEVWSQRKEINHDEKDPVYSKSMVPGKCFAYWGIYYDHAAVYFGTDSKGMNYWISKNGMFDSKPKLMSEEKLKQTYYLWNVDYFKK